MAKNYTLANWNIRYSEPDIWEGAVRGGGILYRIAQSFSVQERAEIMAAFDEWNKPGNVNFSDKDRGGLGIADPQLYVVKSSSNGFAKNPYMTIEMGPKNRPLFTIVIDGDVNHALGAMQGTDKNPDLFTTILHEAGHVLGLGDVKNKNDIMNERYVGDFHTISPGAAEGVAAIYGRPSFPYAYSLSDYANANVLTGSAYNDTLTGLGGKDVLTGGGGRDTFYYKSAADSGPSAARRDVIKDFVKGQDKIDLHEIDANGSAGGNGSFRFNPRDDAKFSGARGEMIINRIDAPGKLPDRTILQMDINGDKKADMSIELTGWKLLSTSDFIL